MLRPPGIVATTDAIPSSRKWAYSIGAFAVSKGVRSSRSTSWKRGSRYSISSSERFLSNLFWDDLNETNALLP